MTDEQRRRLRNIKTFPQLIAFLRDELDWPIERGEDEDDLTFDWSDDLGLEASAKVGIKEIKQLRPLESGQPWGIFFINFEKKRLPIVILRRILNALVVKKRASANKAQRAAWQQHDLLFISAYGVDDERQLTFAHFSEPTGELVDTNPPYSGRSWNLTPELRRVVEPYRFVRGQRIKEKGALQLEKSIQEDYIKFFRNAELHLTHSTVGVLGLVTSHGFLDNPFLRGMRSSVLSTFERLFVLDLHGNALRREQSPDGTPDKNVFDIQKTGIAISLFRRLLTHQPQQVEHADLWGDRSAVKYPWLISNTIVTTPVELLSPRPASFLLVPQDLANLRLHTVDGRGDWKTTVGIEDIFDYMVAILHSPGYRQRFAAQLNRDFPRIPLTGNLALFRALVSRGLDLVTVHLMKLPEPDKEFTRFVGNRKSEIQKISWSRNTVYVDKAQTTGFAGVPEEVWNFHIGGYQVCEKWLKDRKGRTLSKDDIEHYHRIVVALAETIRLMSEIDKVIDQHGGWPGAFQATPSGAEAIAASENVVELQSKKPQSIVEYANKPLPLLKAAESDPPREPVAREKQTDDSPIPVDELDRAELMCTIRQMFGDCEHITRDEAVKALSSQLGYERVGSHIGEELDNAIRTAVRRGIVVRNGDSLSLLARSIEGFKRDFLKDQFLASMQGHSWTERDDAIRGFARWMGFRRTGQSIDETARSLINGLIRDGSLESESGAVRRVP